MQISKVTFFSLFFLITTLWAEPIHSDHVKAELISEVLSIQPGRPIWVAVRLQMDKHWHTYWRNPGDSGLPTKIEWKLPKGFHASDIQWPYPQRFDTTPIVSFGYEEEVLLLTMIEVPESINLSKNVVLSASVDWLECKDICLPGHSDLKIALPVKDEVPKFDHRWAKQFEMTRKNVPITYSDWKINAKHDESLIIIQLIPPVWFNGKILSMIFFPEQAGVIDHSAPQKILKTKKGYIIRIKRSPFAEKPPARLKGVLVSQEGWRGPGSERALQIDVPLQ
ncbi:MAG: protein-disulfide reductase DsbD domain-containing protein [bacterium]